MSQIEELLSGEKKLEFGNKEQIEAIDDFAKAQKETEENERCYIVEYGISGTLVFEVFAEREDDARDKAEEDKWEQYLDDCGDMDMDFHFLEIRLKDKEE